MTTETFYIQGWHSETDRIISDVLSAESEEAALRLFNQIHGPRPDPHTPGYSEAFSWERVS